MFAVNTLNNYILRFLDMASISQLRDERDEIEERLTEVENRLEKLSLALWDVEKELFGHQKNKKAIISEDILETFILEGISIAGCYGGSRDLLRVFLCEEKGIVMTKYFKLRVNRMIKRLVETKKISCLNNLFTLYK